MVDIFIAYSHNDLSYKNELKKFLRPLLREGRISVWDDFDIEAGEDWDATIKERLYGAGIVLLLVSADSLASDYFYGREVEVSLGRHIRGEATVVPVILRHCDWAETPLGALEALPEKGRPVSEWPSRDQAFQDIVSRLRRMVEKFEQKSTARAEELRRFESACLAADHLFDKKNWAEARASYTTALAAYRPGFNPDRAALQARIEDCSAQIHSQKSPVSQQMKQASPHLPISTSRLVGIVAGIGLVLILLFVRPWKESAQNKAITQATADSLAYVQTMNLGTVVAWKKLRDQSKDLRWKKAAEGQLQRLEYRLDSLYRVATTFIKLDEPESAKILLQEVLRINPDHVEAKQKLSSL